MGSTIYKGLMLYYMRGSCRKTEPYDYENEMHIVADSMDKAVSTYRTVYDVDPVQVQRQDEPLIVIIPEDYSE